MAQCRAFCVNFNFHNEKYCGDVLYQKTYTRDYLTHKSSKNWNILAQYHWENCHPAIIERSRWEKAQALLHEKKWNKRPVLVQNMEKKFVVSKIKSGLLCGYYLIDATLCKEDRKKFMRFMESIHQPENLVE